LGQVNHLPAEDILATLDTAVLAVARDGRVQFCNPAGARLLGRQTADVIGQSCHELLHPARAAEALCVPAECGLRRALSSGLTFQAEGVFQRRDGRDIAVQLSCAPLVEGTEQSGLVLSFSDITERKALVQALEQQALHDPLTGVANRALLQDRLEHAVNVSNRNTTVFGLAILDLNDFKLVNDRFGHDEGDRVLQAVAARLSQSLRRADTVARFGGDEFCLVLTGVRSIEDAQVVARKIHDRAAITVGRQPQATTVQASVGLALYPLHTQHLDSLLRMADEAMYVAKRNADGWYIWTAD